MTVDFLVACNYSWDLLMSMGMRQLEALYDLAHARRQNELLTIAINQRVSYHGDGEQFTKYSEDLTGE